MNCYMHLLHLRCASLEKKNHFFSTFFYSELVQQGFEKVMNFLKKEKLSELEQIFIPIHIPSHFMMVVVNPLEKTIRLYDPLQQEHPDIITNILLYFHKLQALKNNPQSWVKSWEKKYKTNYQKQIDSHNCGVIVCYLTAFISLGKKDDRRLKEFDINNFRQQIALEIIHRKLFKCQISLPLYEFSFTF